MAWSYGGYGVSLVAVQQTPFHSAAEKPLNEPMGEGAYLSSEEVMKKTSSKNGHCEDAGEEAEKWHDCYKSGGDYQDGYRRKPAARSGAFNAFVIGGAMQCLLFAHLFLN